MGSAAGPFLPRLIRVYRQRNRDVELHLSEMTPEQQLPALESGAIDIGFSRPFPNETREWLDSELIYRDRLVLALPKEHWLASLDQVDLRDVAAENFVQFHRRGAPGLFDACMALCRRARFTPRIVYETNLMATVLTLVESSLGVSLVPYCVRYLHHRECRLRPVKPVSPAIELRMAWRRRPDPPAVAAFREIVSRHKTDIQAHMQR
jgi:DNA-binding transcriptional LysR family regulator